MLDEFPKTSANYAPLSPIGLLARTADVHPERVAVRYGQDSYNYAEMRDRCRRLGSALVERGIERGDVVSIMAPNVPAHLEAHFGVPMAGAVLHSINVRLDAATVAFMLGHGESKLLLVDVEFLPLARAALVALGSSIDMIVIEDATIGDNADGSTTYEQLLTTAHDDFRALQPLDDWDAIALNYTSGTTGDPKGVVYHHRGAYLNSVGNTLAWAMDEHPVYLWTLPMFHCNGWCFPWTITAMGGTHVCLRRVDPEPVITAIAEHGVTHLAGAPIVLSRIVNAPLELRRLLPPGIRMMVAGAPPPAAVIAAAEEIGLDITQTYGLTEVYGPCVVCEWKAEWNELPAAERARLKARQGVRYHLQDAMDVLDPESMSAVT